MSHNLPKPTRSEQEMENRLRMVIALSEQNLLRQIRSLLITQKVDLKAFVEAFHNDSEQMKVSSRLTAHEQKKVKEQEELKAKVKELASSLPKDGS